MPEKRITRESILAAATEVLKESGSAGLHARAVAKKLGCSTQPVYSEFGSMAGLEKELICEAGRRHKRIVDDYLKAGASSAYSAYGLGFVKFARQEKALFRYVYMRDRHSHRAWIEDVNTEDILRELQAYCGFDLETAVKFHYDMAIYSYGLAVLCNTGYLPLDDEEVLDRLKLEFTALGNAYHANIAPAGGEKERL